MKTLWPLRSRKSRSPKRLLSPRRRLSSKSPKPPSMMLRVRNSRKLLTRAKPSVVPPVVAAVIVVARDALVAVVTVDVETDPEANPELKVKLSMARDVAVRDVVAVMARDAVVETVRDAVVETVRDVAVVIDPELPCPLVRTVRFSLLSKARSAQNALNAAVVKALDSRVSPVRITTPWTVKTVPAEVDASVRMAVIESGPSPRVKLPESLVRRPRRENRSPENSASVSPEKSSPSPSLLLKKRLVSLSMTTWQPSRPRPPVSTRSTKSASTKSSMPRTSLESKRTPARWLLQSSSSRLTPWLLVQALMPTSSVSRPKETMMLNSAAPPAAVVDVVVVATDPFVKIDPRPSVVDARVANSSLTTTTSLPYEQ
jgi:hypothetical protein